MKAEDVYCKLNLETCSGSWLQLQSPCVSNMGYMYGVPFQNTDYCADDSAWRTVQQMYQPNNSN